MGEDEAALIRLWREKRGEVGPEDLSRNLPVQLGLVTEELNRCWYATNTGEVITDVQKHVRHPTVRWLAATPDGRVQSNGAVFESKFMLPWYFSEEAAAAKYMPQLQHNMWVVAARSAVLSIITGGGKWVEIKVHADPIHQHLIMTAERKFWRCVETGERPRLSDLEPPKPRIEAVRIVDMSSSNAWAEFAGIFARTKAAHTEHEQAKAELEKLVPEDAHQAIGHGVRAKSSNPAPSASISSRRRIAVQRSSESIASLAGALAKAQIELTNPEKSLIGTIASDDPERASGPFATLRCQAGSISCAKCWVNMKSPRCRPPRSIKRAVSSISPRCWRMHPENGSRQIGRSVRSARRQPRIVWDRRSLMRGAMRCSPSSAWRGGRSRCAGSHNADQSAVSDGNLETGNLARQRNGRLNGGQRGRASTAVCAPRSSGPVGFRATRPSGVS